MRRRLFNWLFPLLAAVSLVLAVVVSGLWVRSVWWQTDILLIDGGGPSVNAFCGVSGRGQIGLWATDVLEGPRWSIMPYNAGPTAWTPVVSFNVPAGVGGRSTGGSIADWLLLLILLVLPAYWVVRVLRHCQEPGTCSKCGYDLRASKDTCPECGEPIPAETPRKDLIRK